MKGAQATAPRKPANWVLALPRLTARERNLGWLHELTQAVKAGGSGVSWAVPASARHLEAPAGVPVYPAFDLTDAHDLTGPHTDPVWHNVDGPRPLADRLRHVWGAFHLGAADVCLVPNARLADLQALWSLYATTDLAQAPVMVLRVTEFAPAGGGQAFNLDELLEALRWVAYRLASLDVLGKKVLLWPGSEIIRALLTEAGLACLPAWPVQTPRALPAVLFGFPVVADDVVALADQLRSRIPGLHVDSVGVGLRGEQPSVGTAPSPVPVAYQAAVVDAEMLPLVAVADIQMAAAHCVVVGALSVGHLAGVARLRDALAQLRPDELALSSAAAAPVRPIQAVLADLQAELTAAQATAPKPLPVVVHIAPGWAGAGSSHVFSTQLQWLREQQLPTICLHLDTDDMEANQAQDSMRGRLQALPGGDTVNRWFLTRPARNKELERRTGIPSAYDSLSLEGEERIARQVAIPDSLHQFLRHREVRFVLLNYGHNWPVVDRLGLAGKPVLIETHDIRPVQHGLYNNEPTIESAVDVELAMFSRASCAVFINDDERQRFAKAYPATPAAASFPFQDQLEPQPAASHFETASTSILSAAAFPFDLVDELLTPSGLRHRRIAVFVGSTHKANVLSLEWFLTQAYPLGLVDPRLTIVVVGNIRDALPAVNLPNVVFAGRMHELNSVYRAADLILLPIRTGTGLPIKSVDALTMGAPFVATTPAISAIPGLAEAVGVADTPEAFAERTRALLFDPAADADFRRRIAELKKTGANWRVYSDGWNKIADLQPQDTQTRQPAPKLSRMAPPLGHPAGQRNGEYYFWRGHGLDEVVGAEVHGSRLQIIAPYVRLGLVCWVGAVRSPDLELSLTVASGAELRCIIALNGEVQGRCTLGQDGNGSTQLHLRVPVQAMGTLQRIALELRFDTTESGPVGLSIERLVVRPETF